MVKIVATLLLALLFAGQAIGQGAFSINNPNFFPNTCKKAGQVALVYAEGPSRYTAEILANTAGLVNASALSFMPVTAFLADVTSNVPLRQAASAGALIGLRWDTRVNLANATDATITAKLNADCETLRTYTGKAVKYIFLPPDQVTAANYATVVAAGYVPFYYNLDSADYQFANANDQAACVATIVATYRSTYATLPNGAAYYVAINRDLYPCSAAAAAGIVNVTKAYGYQIVDLATCLGDANPYRTSCGATTATPPPPPPPPAASATAPPPAASTSSSATGASATPKSGALSLGYSSLNVLAALAAVALAFARL